MPHRGRLNVLAAVMGKPYHRSSTSFRAATTQGHEDFASGDVKYHLGSSSDREFDGNEVHLSLTANPSHLEAVNPVVLGKARAKQPRCAASLGEDANTANRSCRFCCMATPPSPARASWRSVLACRA
jgi:2-oxoglutarate dehydrogenase E1 component